MAINLKNLELINREVSSYLDAKLLIVTKKRTIEDIRILIHKGFYRFGENRVQEAKLKYSQLSEIEQKKIELDLIGPLQTNKVSEALELFNTIQSLDRKKLVDKILEVKNRHSNVKTKKYFIQINIGDEEQKSGIRFNELDNFYDYCTHNELKIEGLMCIPPNGLNPNPYFQKMLSARNKLNKKLKLSMGMSGDYVAALSKGSNLVRLGSIIFD